jgi:uncharacterized protein (TIGR00369 family)
MLEFPTPIPFGNLLGLKLVRYENGEAEVTLEARPDLMNSWSVVHGGVTMTLLDVCMSHAARSSAAANGQDVRGAATVEMKTSFMRPSLGALTCKAKMLHRTATMAFVEGTVTDSAGELLSHATGTFKFLRAMPTSDRQVRELNSRVEPGAKSTNPKPEA